MQVFLKPEQLEQLAEIAQQRDITPAELAQRILSRFLEDDSHFPGVRDVEL